MRPPLNVNAMTRKIDVDDRIPLRNYYRIADNLLKQANIYREENNIIDLYVILLRYSSLVLDTIKFHRDYNLLCSKERAYCKKQLLVVVNELESLKPEFSRQVDRLNKAHTRSEKDQPNGQLAAVNNRVSFDHDNKQYKKMDNRPSWNQKTGITQKQQSSSVYMQFQKLSLLPTPRQETLSKHSLLGPNGLRGQWSNPSTQMKVQYPAYADLNSNDNLSLIQSVQSDITSKDNNTGLDTSTMESVLSLDDGRWARLKDDQFDEDLFLSGNIRQPSPPPVLAQLQQEHSHISPSQVADPRPGPANSFQDDSPTSNTYHHLHIPVKMMQDFLRLANANTKRNLETCGVLAGSLKNRNFQITTLIIPKQESTSDSCQTLNEEDIFEVQDKRSLFPLGWIHTHPTQTCFMSSVDLHTHYSYQIMLPEAIAIVMAPTDESSPHGIFHLSDPAGVNLIRKCDQRGFHPHEEPDDGSPIYEHCSHVYMNETLNFDVVDLR
ncbi:AMSH-like ubiquitin thioesterase 3 [Bidens hawaiensis]|uniref:AMSH-like ubiquitin thioesterase 3 n=1 Tax=Bidens hawaiensis TaxID=980011 RepID=UPI00404B4EED